MDYVVDGNSVNSREDWRHTRLPHSPQSSRVGMFPGVGERFVIRDVAMPPGVVVEGYLQAVGAVGSAVANLHSQIDTWGVRMATRTTHSVRVHSTTLSECYLERFEPIGRVEAFESDAGTGIMQKFRWVWVRLK